MDELKNKLKRKIERYTEKLKPIQDLEHSNKLSSHGYYTLGYYKAQVSCCEDLLDFIDEIEEKQR